MTELKYETPVIGEEFSKAAPKVDTGFENIRAWANGQIDSANIKAGGLKEASYENKSVSEAKLSEAVQKRLGEAVTVGAWEPLTPGPKCEEYAGFGLQTARVRHELGLNVARLRGLIKVRTGQTLMAGETLLTLPVGYRPPGLVFIQSRVNKTLVNLEVATTGVVFVSEGAESSNEIPLDGLTFNLT